MVQLGDGLDIGDNHPLVAEISSLKLAVSRFQDEAHSSSVKLQRQSLENAKAYDRTAQLERENDALRAEIAILRANPHPDASPQAHPAALQVQQLTLSLRRLSDKLSLTEDALLTRTTELTHAMGESTKAKHAAEGAYELAARTRGREEAGKVREIELEWKVKAAEEAVKMSDLVVNEYADLVRALNAKTGKGPIGHSRSYSTTSALNTEEDPSSNIGMANLPESLSQGKFGLQRLLAEFSGETEKLQTELLRLHAEVETAEAKCEAERKVSEQCRVDLANALFELQKLKLEDNAAAKMVSRYMKFSQKATDTLQDAMTALKTRQSATVATLSAQLYDVSRQLRSSEADAERLRTALDEFGADILKETYGRRREVALRIRMVNREEKIREDLDRWLLRAEESLERDGDKLASQREMVQSARDMLYSLDGPPSSSSTSSGSLARLILARNAVEELSTELEVETAKKLHLEGILAQINETSSTTSDQDATGRIANGVANVVEPMDVARTAEPTPEDKTGLVSPNPPSISPPSTKIVLPPLPIEKTEKFLVEETLPTPTIRPPALDQLPEASAEFPTNLNVAQMDTQEVPLAANPTPVVLLNTDPSPQVPEKQTRLDEAITALTREPPVPEAPNHDPIPLVMPEPSSLETHILEVEVLEEPKALNRDPMPSQPPLPETHIHIPEAEVLEEPKALNHDPMPLITLNPSFPVTHALEAGLLENPQVADHDPMPLVSLPLETDIHIPETEVLKEPKAPNHDPTSPEPPTLEAEVAEEPTVPSSTADPNPQTFVSFPLEQTLSDDQLPGIEISHSPPENNVPFTNSHESPPEIPSPSPSTPRISETSPPPLLNIPEPPSHPLLVDLVRASHRYDDLQRAFRDCHLALEALKASISSTSLTDHSKSGVTSPDILRTALERLNDYTEDARVELEIRIADESLMARGFETLLSVPGALSSPSMPSHSLLQDDMGGLDTAPTQHEVERQIEDFISGTTPAVEKAFGNFTRKLDDIQHDIAALKRAAHDPVLSPTAPTTAPMTNGGSWSSWILNSPSTSSSPAPGPSPGTAPTFGNVMTTPRLRHSPSLNFQARPQKGYLGGGSKDAFAALGLKVPMPSYVHVPETPQRSRTVSTMYMLGLGARRPSASGSFASPTQHNRKPPPRLGPKDDETTDDEPESGDEDVE